MEINVNQKKKERYNGQSYQQKNVYSLAKPCSVFDTNQHLSPDTQTMINADYHSLVTSLKAESQDPLTFTTAAVSSVLSSFIQESTLH